MRKLYWYVTAYVKKHGWIFLVSVVVAVTLFSVFIPQLISKLEVQDYKYIGIIGSHNLANLPDEITSLLSAGLTKIDEDGSVSPVLAERWTVEQENKVYRFVLKEDLFWQDGKPVVPDDVKYQLKDTEPTFSPNDIIYRLPDTFAPFPTLVTEPIFRTGTMKQYYFFSRPTIIGIGSNRIIDYSTKGDRLTELVIDTNDDRIIYRFYLNERDAITAFKRGEIDSLSNISNVSELEAWSTINVQTNVNFDQYLGIFFNHRDPRFFQKNVRQALSYAIEKPQGDIRAIGPINPKSWAYLEGGKKYEKDLERAVERMLAELPPEPLSFELKTPASFVDTAEQLKVQWEEFGELAYQACQDSDDIEDKSQCENTKISVNITITRFVDTNDFTVYLLGQEIPADPDQYFLWHSEQNTNFVGYKNTRIDNLLEKGRQTLEVEERLEIYQEFQQFFLEDSPIIFLRHLETYSIERT